MCCYNAQQYIKETVDSILCQTFSDFEFIIWNDGSTDGTEEIIKSYSDERIRLFSDINRGEGKAAQLACEQVRAAYIARIDSDDLWLPTKLKEEYDYMESHPDVALVSCPAIFIDQNGKELGLSFPITNTSYLTRTISKGNRFVHSGTMYRTEIYKKTGGYKDLRLFQDRLLFNQISEYGSLSLLPKPLIKYRLLPNSVAHRIDKSPYLPIIREFQHKIIRDKGRREEDLKVFNALYGLIGKAANDDGVPVYVRSTQMKVYDVLKKIIGKERAYSAVTFLMNLRTI